MTALDLISSSLRLINVLAINETPESADANNALSVLNMMLDQWNTQKFNLYYFLNELFPITAGTATYNIGPSATFNTDRPVEITSAFIRDGNPGFNIDRQLEVIPNDKYQALVLKTLMTVYPQYVMYVASYPIGVINLYPVPNISGLYLGLSQKKKLSSFAALTTTITLPPGYESALRYNLAIELAAEYSSPISPIIGAKAAEYLGNIRRVNHQDLLMANDSLTVTKGGYSIYRDY
jgi:hypothetical protein